MSDEWPLWSSSDHCMYTHICAPITYIATHPQIVNFYHWYFWLLNIQLIIVAYYWTTAWSLINGFHLILPFLLFKSQRRGKKMRLEILVIRHTFYIWHFCEETTWMQGLIARAFLDQKSIPTELQTSYLQVNSGQSVDMSYGTLGVLIS